MDVHMRRRRKSRMRLQHSRGEMEDVGEQRDHDMIHALDGSNATPLALRRGRRNK